MSNFFKRIVPVLLVLVLCFSCLVSPVSASSFDNGRSTFINLLDYGTSTNGTNVAVTDSSGNASITYNFPYDDTLTTYIDVVISCTYTTPSAAFAGRPGYSTSSTAKRELNVLKLSDYAVRVYGRVPSYYYDSIELNLISDNPNFGASVFSFYVTNNYISFFEEVGGFTLQEQSGETYSYSQSSYGASAIHNIFLNTNFVGSRSLQIVAYCVNWKKYDFLEFEFHAEVSSITSIFAWVNNISVPTQITYLGPSVEFDSDRVLYPGTQQSIHDFLVTVDLRAVDRSSDKFSICIDAEVPWAQGGNFGLGKVHGFIQDEASNSTNFFFRNILDKLELFRANFFSVMGSLQTNLSTWITDLGTYLGNLITTLNNNLVAGFTNIATKLNTLISGSEEQQENASDFNDSVSDQSSELEEMTGIMDSVEKPDVGDINMDLSGMVDPTVITVATTGIGSLLSNQIILRVLLLSFTFGLIGFILYGKK